MPENHGILDFWHTTILCNGMPIEVFLILDSSVISDTNVMFKLPGPILDINKILLPKFFLSSLVINQMNSDPQILKSDWLFSTMPLHNVCNVAMKNQKIVQNM